MNECSWDYVCPVVCPGRSKDCHVSCERHDKFRELRAQERQARYLEATTDPIILKAEKIRQKGGFREIGFKL